jgi:hypothetical protein
MSLLYRDIWWHGPWTFPLNVGMSIVFIVRPVLFAWVSKIPLFIYLKWFKNHVHINSIHYYTYNKIFVPSFIIEWCTSLHFLTHKICFFMQNKFFLWILLLNRKDISLLFNSIDYKQICKIIKIRPLVIFIGSKYRVWIRLFRHNVRRWRNNIN